MKNKQTMIKKEFAFETKDVNFENYTMKVIVSSGQPDRGGDITEQSWLLDNYNKNPVVLWGHDNSIPAVGKALSIGINNDGMLEAVIQFAVEHSALARELWGLYSDKFLNAFSAGFVPGNIEEMNGFRILKNNELLEFSCVNVPMDALALAKSAGLSVSMIEKSMTDESTEEEPEVAEKGNFEEITEKEERVLSSKNRKLIENALSSLDALLKADKGANGESKKKYKMKRNKIINKAIRELMDSRK